MRTCYEQPYAAHQFGRQAAKWLSVNQTWDHAAEALIALLRSEGVFEREKVYA
jgi:hypothetical protein